jgi:hypothetical protein
MSVLQPSCIYYNRINTHAQSRLQASAINAENDQGCAASPQLQRFLQRLLMIKLNRSLFFQLIVTLAGIPLGSSSTSAHQIYTAGPDTYRARLKALEPGAYLWLIPGEYKDGLSIHYLHGTAETPITISGLDSGPRAILRDGRGITRLASSIRATLLFAIWTSMGVNWRWDGVKCEGHAD